MVRLRKVELNAAPRGRGHGTAQGQGLTLAVATSAT